MRRGALTLGLLLAAACDDGEARVALPCDVRSSACQRSIFEAVAEVRAQRGARPPPVRIISRARLAEELRAGVEASQAQEPDEATIAWQKGQRAIALLGVLPREQSYDDAYVDQAVDSIAAYYSSLTRDITIIADSAEDENEATFTLAHEYVHALQDQREGLPQLRNSFVSTSDSDVALTSLIEGEATWLSIVTYRGAVRGEDPQDIDVDTIFGSSLEATLQDIAAASAPLINAEELLPYPLGGALLARRYLHGGAASIAELYAGPAPVLLAWVDDPSLHRVALDSLPEPLDCGAPAPPQGYGLVLEDRLGFAGLLALRAALGQSGKEAFEAATRWRADQVASYAASDDTSDAVAVAWRIRLQSESAAQQLMSELSASLVPLVVAAAERELLISAASDPALLESWPAAECPAQGKGRGVRARGGYASLRARLGIVR